MLTLLNQDKRWLAWIDPPSDLLSRWRQQSQIVNTEIMILRSNQKNSAFDLAKAGDECRHLSCSHYLDKGTE